MPSLLQLMLSEGGHIVMIWTAKRMIECRDSFLTAAHATPKIWNAINKAGLI
jgi:hypothetical protein